MLRRYACRSYMVSSNNFSQNQFQPTRITAVRLLCLWPWATQSHSHSQTTNTSGTMRAKSRSFTASHSSENLNEPTSAPQTQTPAVDKICCPQGIQGSDCATFELWFDNCRNFRLPNCQEDIRALNDGTKNIADILKEQEELISKISADYRVNSDSSQLCEHVHLAHSDISSQQGVQEVWPNVERPLLEELSAVDNPCPEGTQGDDCDRLRHYLASCRQYKFSDCEQQLREVQSGRKTIGEILRERDEVLREICDYNERRTPRKDSETEVKLSQGQRLKRAVKEYGAVVVVFHVAISLLSLGASYTAVSSGLDMVAFIEKTGLMSEAFGARLLAGTGTFVVAYAVHKVFVPVRMAITLASTPFIVRHLRRIGFLKAPK